MPRRKFWRLISLTLCLLLIGFAGVSGASATGTDELHIYKTCPEHEAEGVPVNMPLNLTFDTTVQLIDSEGISVSSSSGSKIPVALNVDDYVIWLDYEGLLPAQDTVTVKVYSASVARGDDATKFLAEDYEFSFQTGNELVKPQHEYYAHSFVVKLDGSPGGGSGGGDISENRPPVAEPDYYRVQKDDTLERPAPGVLSNDSDPDGDSLTAAVYSEPSHGKLVLNPDGSFVYTPEADFLGDDIWTYRAFDGELYSEETEVSISVYKKSSSRKHRDKGGDESTVPSSEDKTSKDENGKSDSGDPEEDLTHPSGEDGEDGTTPPGDRDTESGNGTAPIDEGDGAGGDATSPETPQVEPPAGKLPQTGGNCMPLVGLGTILAGVGLVLFHRRRSPGERCCR